MSATPRLYVTPDLGEGLEIPIGGDQAHYLLRVLRLEPGGLVRVFNGRDGEFGGRVTTASKSALMLKLGQRMRAQHAPPDLWVLFAPLKKSRTDFVVEKATELGATEICPVLTERTDAEVVRTDRLQRIALEAAEQTERLDVPQVRDAVKLAQALFSWEPGRILIYADEAGDERDRPWGGEVGRARPVADVFRELTTVPAAILIGPEGGFSPDERRRLHELPQVKPVSLGPRILRAETAAVATLSLWQAIRGDWRG